MTLRRRLLAGLLAAAAVAWTPGVAAAIDLPGPLPDINLPSSPPTSESPYDVGAYDIDKGPTDPRPGNPFAADPATSIYEQYGYAGIRFTTYDLGFGAESAGAASGTQVANTGLRFATWWVAFTASSTRFAYNTDTYARPVQEAVDSANESFRAPWMLIAGVVFLVVAVVLAFTNRSTDYLHTTRRVGAVVGVLIAGLMLLGGPTRLVGWVFDTVTGVFNTLQQAVDGADGPSELGVAFTANQHEAVLYNAWLAGTFGRAESEAAAEFGPRLFDATAWTFAEADQALANPDRAAEIAEEKQQEWEAAYSELEAKYPWVAANVRGEDPGGRIWQSVLANLGAITTSIPALLSAWLTVMFLMALLLFALVGAWLLLGALLRTSLLIGAVSAVGMIGMNAVLFGLVTGLFTLAAGAMLGPSSELTGWQAGLLILVTAVALWFMTRRIRRVDQTGKSRQFLRDWGNRALNTGATWLGAHGGAQSGVQQGLEAQQQAQQQPGGTTSTTTAGAGAGQQSAFVYMPPAPPDRPARPDPAAGELPVAAPAALPPGDVTVDVTVPVTVAGTDVTVDQPQQWEERALPGRSGLPPGPTQPPPPPPPSGPAAAPGTVTVLAPDTDLPAGIREVYPVVDGEQDVYPLYGYDEGDS